MESARWIVAFDEHRSQAVFSTTYPPGELVEMCANGDLVCPVPECSDPRISFVQEHRRLGRRVSPHFRHRVAPDERTHGWESVAHLLAKLHMQRWALDRGFLAVVERKVSHDSGRRPDVTVVDLNSGQQLFIEVQYAAIDPSLWARRTRDLTASGGTVVWFWGVGTGCDAIRPSAAQQRCLSETGRLYVALVTEQSMALGAAVEVMRSRDGTWIDHPRPNTGGCEIVFAPIDEWSLRITGPQLVQLEDKISSQRAQVMCALAAALDRRHTAVVGLMRRFTVQLAAIDQHVRPLLEQIASEVGTVAVFGVEPGRAVWKCQIGRLGVAVPFLQSPIGKTGWDAVVDIDDHRFEERLWVSEGRVTFRSEHAVSVGARTVMEVGDIDLCDVAAGHTVWSNSIDVWSPFAGMECRSGWVRDPSRARGTGGVIGSLSCGRCLSLTEQVSSADRWLPLQATTWKAAICVRGDLMDRESCVRFVAEHFDLDEFDAGRAVRAFWRHAGPHLMSCPSRTQA